MNSWLDKILSKFKKRNDIIDPPSLTTNSIILLPTIKINPPNLPIVPYSNSTGSFPLLAVSGQCYTSNTTVFLTGAWGLTGVYHTRPKYVPISELQSDERADWEKIWDVYVKNNEIIDKSESFKKAFQDASKIGFAMGRLADTR